jgi:hypothetical protein
MSLLLTFLLIIFTLHLSFKKDPEQNSVSLSNVRTLAQDTSRHWGLYKSYLK